MSHDLFTTTLKSTQSWVDDLMFRLKWDDPHRAWHGLRAVLHVLRDRLTVEEAVALGAQLPMLLRGAYYEGWRPAATPVRMRSLEDVYRRVGEHLHGYEGLIDPEEVTVATLDVLSDHNDPGEVVHLRQVLPRDLRSLVSPG